MADPNSEDIKMIMSLTSDLRGLAFAIEKRASSIRARDAMSRSRCQAMVTRATGKTYRCVRFDDHRPIAEHFYEDQIWPGGELINA